MSSREVLDTLYNAIKEKNLETVRDTLSKEPKILDFYNYVVQSSSHQKTRSPLWEALIYGFEEIIELLIDHGANADERNVFEKNKFLGLPFFSAYRISGMATKNGENFDSTRC